MASLSVGGAGTKYGSFADMVLDPCNSVLEAGVFGTAEGFCGRFKSDYVGSTGIGATCGFILWCPNYSDKNLYIGWSLDPTAAPRNDSTVPYGTDGTGYYSGSSGTTRELSDPVAAFVAGDTCADFRLISACLRMTYLGTTMNTAGQFCYVENMPTDALLNGGPGSVCPTVNQLFAANPKSQRTSLTTVDHKFAVYQPNLSELYHDESDAPMLRGSGTPTTVSTDGKIQNPRWFGFAWRGLTEGSDASALSFEFIKNIEWRPEPASGLASQPPHQSGVNVMPHILRIADAKNPHWRTMISSGEKTAEKFVLKAFQGVENAAKRGTSGIGALVGRAVGIL